MDPVQLEICMLKFVLSSQENLKSIYNDQAQLMKEELCFMASYSLLCFQQSSSEHLLQLQASHFDSP
jgi:hypothetical protein